MNRTVLLAAAVGLAVSVQAAWAADDARAKELATRIKTELRAVENGKAADAPPRLAEAERLLGELRSAHPQYPELTSLNSRYHRLVGMFPGAPAVKTPEGAEGTSGSAGPGPEFRKALEDWEALLALRAGFEGRLRPLVPHGENVIYTPETIDQVIVTLRALRAEAPGVQATLRAFAGEYGETRDAVDRKLAALTPRNPAKSLLDPENRRPDDSAGDAYVKLLAALNDLESAPVHAARLALNQAVEQVNSALTFVADTERDRSLAEIESRIALAAKLNPADADIRAWRERLQALRRQSAADIEKALDAARFPGPAPGFKGPGSPEKLAQTATEYFNAAYPSEKALKASVAGDWLVTRRDIFGNPVQWGLPVYVAARQDARSDLVRVFRMTLLARVSSTEVKSPPWTDHWTGDSYRMRAKNL